MLKTFLPLALTAAALVSGHDSRSGSTVFSIKEESATIEFTATSGEAVVVFEAESEEVMRSVQVQRPDGRDVLRIWAGGGSGSRISGFIVETGETTPDDLLAHYGEGRYEMAAIASDGRRASGGATLSHALLPAPVALYPLEGDIGVPTTATVRWIPDPNAAEYKIVLEQDENDGLTARLPAGSSSFQIPAGILRSQTVSHVEIGAVAENGNTTLVEIEFVTL